MQQVSLPPAAARSNEDRMSPASQSLTSTAASEGRSDSSSSVSAAESKQQPAEAVNALVLRLVVILQAHTRLVLYLDEQLRRTLESALQATLSMTGEQRHVTTRRNAELLLQHMVSCRDNALY
jgi:aminopeptidase N